LIGYFNVEVAKYEATSGAENQQGEMKCGSLFGLGRITMEEPQTLRFLPTMPQNRKLSAARYDTLALNFLAAATLATTRRR
jgi:hypothetical protein